MFAPELSLTEAASDLVTPEALERYGQLASGQLSTDQLSSPELLVQLRKMTPSSIVGTVDNPSMAECCLSGIWLLYGYLDQSHEISQSNKSTEGSLWHAIMHRLESDFWNSKYWYRNAGPHPTRSALTNRFGNSYPDKFVDDSELAIEQNDSTVGKRVATLAIEEWKLLFQFCYANANPK